MKIESALIAKYDVYLKDKYRPPSKGGNTGAWHQHVMQINGETYSFLARGARKWVFAKDQVSFEWEWDASNRYRNVKVETLVTRDRHGNVVERGDRSSKPWRIAETRLPA
jgi:hypothetical protein